MNKKKTVILSVLSFILIFIIIFMSFKLNIFNLKKLKGEASIYRTYKYWDKICLEEECFYVLEDKGDTVIALAKYGLKIDENKQSENGTSIKFSNSEYWTFNTTSDDYPMDISLESSNLWQPLRDYESYLHELGYSSVTADLVGKEQIDKIGCDLEVLKTDIQMTCNNEITLLPRYWTKIANRQLEYNYNRILVLGAYKNIVPTMNSGTSLIRPTITIDKAEIPGSNIANKKYEYGDEVCILNECFNVLEMTNNKLILLSKYTLNGDTNHQSEEIYKTKFSEDAYWLNEEGNLKERYGTSYPANVFSEENTVVYPMVKNYENLFITNGYESTSARLLTLDDLNKYGIDSDSKLVFYNIQQMLGTVAENQKIYYFENSNVRAWLPYQEEYNIGIRPVIEINIDDFEGNDKVNNSTSKTEEVKNDTTTTIKTITEAKTTTKKVAKSVATTNLNVENDVYINGSVITKQVVEKIKDTDKNIILNNGNLKIIINGKDIKNTDEIDLSAIIKKLDDSIIKDKIDIKDGIVLYFNSKNIIPKMKIELNMTNDMINHTGKNNISVYKYDGTLYKVAENINIENNKLTFNINDLGTYVITNKEIINKVVNDEVLINSNGKHTNYVLFIIPILLILTVIGIIKYRRDKE